MSKTKLGKPKHTPGPWKYEFRFSVRTPGGEFIANTNSPSLTAPSASVMAANARLIACAPDLLDGLKQAVDQLEADYELTPLDGHRALIDKLRATIAKAEGETI